MAAVIVAIVGNAAEHTGGAVVVAYRGNIKLAAEIALASSAQVAVFLIPAVALISWLIEPLALSFRQVEILAMGGSVLFTALLLFRVAPRGGVEASSLPPTLRSQWRSTPWATSRAGSVNPTSGLALTSLCAPEAPVTMAAPESQKGGP